MDIYGDSCRKTFEIVNCKQQIGFEQDQVGFENVWW